MRPLPPEPKTEPDHTRGVVSLLLDEWLNRGSAYARRLLVATGFRFKGEW